MKQSVSIHFLNGASAFSVSLRPIYRALEDVDVEFVDSPTTADLLIGDSHHAVSGLPCQNEQWHIIPQQHAHSHDLPKYVRMLPYSYPLRTLIKIVREKSAEKELATAERAWQQTHEHEATPLLREEEPAHTE